MIFLSWIVVSACSTENDPIWKDGRHLVEGITFDIFPVLDGSTSTFSLSRLITCKILGIDHEWVFEGTSELWTINPLWYSVPDRDLYSYFDSHVKLSQTHNSFINLIDNEADLILSARKMSDDEKAYAENAGVELIETPVALDALVMLVNTQNPVNSLTLRQIQDIYTGQITNWNEVGGKNKNISPYRRNANSGSQELMELLVMKGLPMADLPGESGIEWVLPSMGIVYTMLQDDSDGICYTVYYYHTRLIQETYKEKVKSIAINGIYPNENTISNLTYSCTAEVYVVIRSDLDQNSPAYKIYQWLQTEAGQDVIAESGYIPMGTSGNSVERISNTDIRIYPNPVTDGIRISGLTCTAELSLFNTSGNHILSKQVENDEYIQLHALPRGIYFLTLTTNNIHVSKKIIKQ
ncbi:MAG: substrate-binding domain-containing protein [Tannerella sp.]|jgi:phosphate transport system substrate-binding protein|nr:substrate-binding domain-containing protein [Tannerella sp.]